MKGNDMELRVEEVNVPEKIGFNYEELKTQLTTRCQEYKSIVYTPETIKDAKADRAMLNKLKDSLNTERLRRQKEYMRPFETFKAQIDDLIGIINDASGAIDQQVKEYEAAEAEKKQKKISELFDQMMDKYISAEGYPRFVKLEDIFDRKWLNKGKSLNTIQGEMEFKLKNIADEVKLLRDEFQDKGYALTVAIMRYKETYDYKEAVSAGKRVIEEEKERQKAEEEKQKEYEAPVSALPETPYAAETQQKIITAALSQQAPEDQKPVQKERIQKVTVEIIAHEAQFGILNDLFKGIKASGAQFRVIAKEEL